MFQNDAAKKILKKTVFRVASVVNQLIPKQDKKIMFYCNNWGVRDNAKYLLDFMIEHHVNDSYTIICGVEKSCYQDENIQNVHYTGLIGAIWEYFTARHVFYTFGQIPIQPARAQKVIHMTHGSPLKKLINPSKSYFTSILATSDFFVDKVKESYYCKEEQVVVCGYPRTDYMYRSDVVYNFNQYQKVILWMPTFRNSDYLAMQDSDREEPLIPLFSPDDWEELNACLKEHKYKLILKLHPHQNLTAYEKVEKSNLSIYSHFDFLAEGYDLYRLLGQTDALITDYSSVCYDYLLKEKPIAYTIDDMNHYIRGFAYDNPMDLMPGVLIQNKKEFYSFLNSLNEEKDVYFEQRKKMNRKVNQFQDGENCMRILKLSQINL